MEIQSFYREKLGLTPSMAHLVGLLDRRDTHFQTTPQYNDVASWRFSHYTSITFPLFKRIRFLQAWHSTISHLMTQCSLRKRNELNWLKRSIEWGVQRVVIARIRGILLPSKAIGLQRITSRQWFTFFAWKTSWILHESQEMRILLITIAFTSLLHA